jgi:hypothetical protein
MWGRLLICGRVALGLPEASSAGGRSSRRFFPLDGARQADRLRLIPRIHNRYPRSVIISSVACHDRKSVLNCRRRDDQIRLQPLFQA